ncbi:MAG: hypothetical protein KY467_07040 [Gemmatimonadetes bacterium]|nr:hypothetical protein [Gemmatimonadota bacterium]
MPVHDHLRAALAAIALLILPVAGCGDTPAAGGAGLKPASVESKRWERVAVVEQRRIEEGEGWELPDSAEVLRRERRFHHTGQEVVGQRTATRQVPRTERVADGTDTRSRTVEERVRTGTREYVCGQRDLGNGYFEDVECREPVYETRTRTETWEEPRYREVTRHETVTEQVAVTRPVPVYRTYYTWRAPRWDAVDTLRASGDTTRPAWPNAQLAQNQRWGARTGRYTVVVRQGAMRMTLHTDLGQWAGLRPGQRVGVRFSAREDGGSPIFPADSLYECQRWHLGLDRRPPPDSLGCSPRPPAPQAQSASASPSGPREHRGSSAP